MIKQTQVMTLEKHYKKFGLKRPKKNPNFTAPLNWKIIEYIKKLLTLQLFSKAFFQKRTQKLQKV